MVDLIEGLRLVQLYCENKGDSFHPMDLELLTALRDNEASTKEKVTSVYLLCHVYAQVFPYHVQRVLDKVAYDEDRH
jgi:hypothetical protein